MNSTPKEGSDTAAWSVYHNATRTATYGFLMALPLLATYEALIWLFNRGAEMPVRITADIVIKRVLPSLGTTGLHMLALAVLLIGICILFVERKKKIPLRPRFGGYLIVESAIYAVLMVFFVSMLTQQVLAAAMHGSAQAYEPDIWTSLALSLGAGLYEELLFRVILVGGMFVGIRFLIPRSGRFVAYLAAAVVGALVFSAVHYIGDMGDEFAMASFLQRALGGLVLNAIFLVRGFAVAAWTHALFDVMVVTSIL